MFWMTAKKYNFVIVYKFLNILYGSQVPILFFFIIISREYRNKQAKGVTNEQWLLTGYAACLLPSQNFVPVISPSPQTVDRDWDKFCIDLVSQSYKRKNSSSSKPGERELESSDLRPDRF